MAGLLVVLSPGAIAMILVTFLAVFLYDISTRR